MVLVVLAVLLAFCACVGCSEAPAGDAGAETTRVVALSPGVAQVMRDVGCGDLLVGRHGYDVWSDQSIPVAGDQDGLDYEALLRLKPTHVLLEPGVLGVPDRLSKMGQEHGWTIESFRMLTLDDVGSCARRLDGLFGSGGSAALAAQLGDLARADAPTRGRVLLLISVEPPAGLGPGCMHDEVLRGLGAVQALDEDAAPYVRLDAEDVLRLAPDAIILIAPVGPGEAGDGVRPLDASELDEALGVLAGLQIPAVREGRVAVVDGAMSLVPSSSVVGFGEALEEALSVWWGAAAD